MVLRSHLAVGFEEFLLIALRDAWSVVSNFNLKVQFRRESLRTIALVGVVPIVGSCFDDDLARAVRNEFDRIGKQVNQNLLQSIHIAYEPHGMHFRFNLDLTMLVVDEHDFREVFNDSLDFELHQLFLEDVLLDHVFSEQVLHPAESQVC
jgi:hypothetical protein